MNPDGIKSQREYLSGRMPFHRSLAIGDALGMAGKAVIRTFSGTGGLVMTRQCINQLQEMELHPDGQIDSAGWSVFQERFDKGYAAEVCHISDVDDLKKMLEAGYTRFSLDPVHRKLDYLRHVSKKELLDHVMKLPWVTLREKFELIFNRYRGKKIKPVYSGPSGSLTSSKGVSGKNSSGTALPGMVSTGSGPSGAGAAFEHGSQWDQESLLIAPGEQEILAAICMYSESILRFTELEKILVTNKVREKVTLEISFDRCDTVLTPFDHYFVINELLRRDVQPDFIAPGSLDPMHVWLAYHAGNYGLAGNFSSVNSWNKFLEESLLPGVPLHGHFPDISYVTALRCAAMKDQALFREIWELSRGRFTGLTSLSDSSLKIGDIDSANDVADEELSELLGRNYAGEFLARTMPAVMTIRDSEGNRYLRNKLYHHLHEHEDRYTELLMDGYRLLS